MYSKIQLASKYIHYYLTAANGKGHGIHSPFVYDFVRNILIDKNKYEEYDVAEKLRSNLLKDETILTIDDFGAGSRTNLQKQRSVREIAGSSLKPKKYSQLLFRIIKFYEPENIIELGTSLGVTTSYLALANKNLKVKTLEGAPAVASVAKINFNKIQLQNIQLTEGNFDATLPKVLKKIKQVDFAFIDGNHRKEPTLNYFKQLLPYLKDSSIIVFDDIHWSKEMEDAWNEIVPNNSVSISIDLFFVGIVFFRKENKMKENFTIRF